MADFPSALFTNNTRRYSGKKQEAFTDYGCWESVDVEQFGRGQPVIFAKKHRSIHAGATFSEFSPGTCNLKSIDARIVVPEHDFMMLGKPEPMRKLIDDNTKFSSLYKDRIISANLKYKTGTTYRRLITTAVQEHYNRLSYDHPDVTHETFLRTMLKYECKPKNAKKGITPKMQAARDMGRIKSFRYLLHIDPTLCDVGGKLLKGAILDEIQTHSLKTYCNRDYTGGCIDYGCIEMSGNKQNGFLACAQGQGLDEICLKLITINCNTEIDSSSSSSYPVKHPSVLPEINLGSEHRQTLNGRILQTEVMQNGEKFLIGVRSDYNVLLNEFNGRNTKWDTEDKRPTFTSDTCVSTLGALGSSGESSISCIALSPFIPGECVIATADRCIRQWTPEIAPNVHIESTSKLQVLMNGTMGGLHSMKPWRQAIYAAHPRQLYVADTENVCIFDIRTSDDSLSLLKIKSSKYAKAREKIYCINGGIGFGNEYQCLIATDFNLYLVDQRFRGEPLVQWDTVMKYPPQYMRSLSIATSRLEDTEFSSSSWTYDTKGVFLANQRPHELYCYQFCNTTRSSTDELSQKRYPPQCIGPPRELEGFGDVWKCLRTEPSKHRAYLESRLSKMTVGLEAVTLGSSLQNGFTIVFQINEVGDIGYQTLSLRPPREAYEASNLVTGGTSTFIESEKERAKALKKLNHIKWAEIACASLDSERVADEVRDTDLATFSECRLQKVDISSYFPHVDPESGESGCCLCKPRNKSQNDHVNVNGDRVCQRCGISTGRSSLIVDFFKYPEKHDMVLNSQGLLGEREAETESPAVPELRLIDWEQTGPEHDNELGRLLKGTWDGSYEEYWEKVKKNEETREKEDKLKQKRLTLDLINKPSGSDSSPKFPASPKPEMTGSKSRRSILKKPGSQNIESPPSRKRKADVRIQSVTSSSPLLSWLSSGTKSAVEKSHNSPSRFFTASLAKGRPRPIMFKDDAPRMGSGGSFLSPSSTGLANSSTPSYSFFSPRREERSSRGNFNPRKNRSPAEKRDSKHVEDTKRSPVYRGDGSLLSNETERVNSNRKKHRRATMGF